MKLKTTIIILCAVLLSCKKDRSSTVLNGALTGCPTNSTCTYSYYDKADFTSTSPPAAGNFRVFAYKSISANACGPISEIYFKTNLSNNEFEINTSQIAAGEIVAYYDACPCCEYANFAPSPKPIGGAIKAQRTDATRWLVNASIIFGTANNTPIDTMVVNQYFVLQKLP